MKKYFSILAALLIFFVGCSNQENGLTEPKADSITQPTIYYNMAPENETRCSVSQIIDGAVGGWIELSGNYVDTLGRLINVNADLFIPKNSFEGQKTITMTADFSNASIEFYPSMQFNKWLSLNVWYKNLPLDHMGYSANDRVDFVYLSDDGNIYCIESKSVSMNYHQGSLKVNNAWLNHFSRYAFVKKAQ